jgi:uncharacterized membrane protein YdbT with pleckstrin-like domain
MGYVESNLISGEEIVYRARYNWTIYLPGIILSIAIIGIFMLIAAWIKQKTDEFAVTNKRVVIKTGLISRKTLEMNLAKIETIGVDQGIFGRMLGYGTITVVGTGGTREMFRGIDEPLDFRKAVQAQSH